MLKLLMGFLIVMMVGLASVVEASLADYVVISEFFYDEDGDDNNEFVELYNPTKAAVDISGWKLTHYNQTGKLQSTVTIPEDTSIAPGGYFLIGEKSPLNSADWGGEEVIPDLIRLTKVDWQNGPGDGIVLKDANGDIIDGLQYGMHKDGPSGAGEGTPAMDAPKGKSLERKSNDRGVIRGQGNGWDTNDNASDFEISQPNPQNSNSPTETAQL